MSQNTLQVPIDKISVDQRKRPLRDITELAHSISEVGLLQPIVVTEDLHLVAGWHRLEACKSLGWETIPAIVVSLRDLQAELAEIDENLIRNELTALERAEHLARRKEIYEMLHPETKDDSPERMRLVRRREIISLRHPTFASDTAAKTGLTPRTIRHEIQIATQIAPEVRDMIRDTPLADEKVELLILARQNQNDQREIAETIINKHASNVREAVVKLQRKKRIEGMQKSTEELMNQNHLEEYIAHESYEEQAKRIPDESIDLIFTDPPYFRESLHHYERIAEIGKRILKPGGSLLCYCGQYLIPDIYRVMTPHLRPWWILAVAYGDGGPKTRMHGYGVIVNWKPVLWFLKGKRIKMRFINDLVQSTRQKDLHDWQQSEVEASYWIDALTPPGGTVWDPFCGSGTTAVAALRLGRRPLTCDIDEEAVRTARARIAEVIREYV